MMSLKIKTVSKRRCWLAEERMQDYVAICERETAGDVNESVMNDGSCAGS